jgi:hypothetical protein
VRMYMKLFVFTVEITFYDFINCFCVFLIVLMF